MGCIRGEWIFPADDAPPLDAIIESLGDRTGLAIDVTRDDDGLLSMANVPVIKEILFDWDRQPNRIRVHSLLPGHPYIWAQLNNVMTGFGGQISDDRIAWRPASSMRAFDRPWTELSKRQRFVLRLPTIGASRPLDFLAEREG